MLNNILNKLFNRDDGDEPPKKKSESKDTTGGQQPAPAPEQQQSPPERPQPQHSQQPAAEQAPRRNLDIPNRINPGLELKAVPEVLPGKPRAWNVVVDAIDMQGIWVSRVELDDDPLPAQPGQTLSLVLFDNRKRLTYDCPVLKVEPGSKEKVLVGPPTKIVQAESQVRNLGGRKHLRISFRLPAEIRKLEGTDLGPPISCHTKDISMSGLAVVSQTPFKQNDEIEIRILSWNFPLKIRAFVVRSHIKETGENVVAVSFPPDMSTISQDLIGQFILENQRAT